MTVTVTAPITVADYKTRPLVKVPTGFTDDQVATTLNAAWATIIRKCNKPLDSTATTDIYTFPSKHVNQTPQGDINISLKYSPVISVTSVKYSTNISSNGWTTLSGYDVIDDYIICHTAPFGRGDYGFFQVVYTSGYATIPDDLKEACALMTAHLLSGGMFPTQGTTGEGSVLPLWTPKDVQATIDNYKRVF